MRILQYMTIIICICVHVASADVPIPANYEVSVHYGTLQNEEQIHFSPINPNHLIAVWRDFRLGYRQVAIGRSTDGGTTWTDSLISPDYQLMTHQSDPALTVDNQGNFYIAILDFRHTGTAIIRDSSYISILKSTDGGLTWNAPVTVVDTIGPYFEDKEFITCDRTGGPYEGNLYVAWTRLYADGHHRQVMFSRSIDGGADFEDTVIIAPPWIMTNGAGEAPAGSFAQPIVGADGSVHVFWMGYDPDGDDWQQALAKVKSTNGGVTWTDPGIIRRTQGHRGEVDGGVNVYTSPSAAADIGQGPFSGNLYIAYANDSTFGNGDGAYDIAFIRSADGGTTWSDPIIINDDHSPYPPYDQFHPWLYCTDEGILTVIFYDQRVDSLTSRHYKFDVFAAYSFDGGQSFTANHRISSVSSHPDFLTSENSRAGSIAEYIGVTTSWDHVNAVWTDTRNFNQDVYGANWTIPRLPLNVFFTRKVDGEWFVLNRDTVRWTGYDIYDDVTYRLQIDDGSDFATPEIDSLMTENELPGDRFPLPDGYYYIRVKGFWSDNDSTAWCRPEFFRIKVSVDMPIDLTPDHDTIISILPSLTWSTETTEIGDYFSVEIADDSLFSPDGFYSYFVQTDSEYIYDYYPDHCAISYWHVNHHDSLGNESFYSPTAWFLYLRSPSGDANGDQTINVGDAVYLINYVFKGGPAPDPLAAGDANCDGSVNVGDAVYLIAYVFKGGPPPVEPCCQ